MTVFIFKIICALFLSTALLVLSKPVISYLAYGYAEPILPVYFPGLNEEEFSDYMILALFHASICYLFVLGTAGCDLLLLTLVVHSYTMAHIVGNAVDEFNAMIRTHHFRETRGSKESRLALRNLILMHKDFIWYTKAVKTCYNEMCLIQITTANVIMILLLYVILMVIISVFFF